MVDDIMRFNEGLDQAIAVSVTTFVQHAARTRDTFLAILGHDLRGPLATITMADASLASPDVGTAATLRIGARVRRSAATMTAMVDDLLEFSRMQPGKKMPVAPSQGDQNKVCQAACSTRVRRIRIIGSSSTRQVI